MKHNRIRMFFEAAGAMLGYLILPCLPRCVLVALARGLGAAGFRLAKRERRIALDNLRVAFGDALDDAGREAIARGAFQTFALTLLDLFWFSMHTEARVKRHVSGDPSLSLFSPKGGGVAVSAHFGNWEVLGLCVGLAGHRPVTVAMPIANPGIDWLLNRSRRLTGQRMVPREGALRSLLKALKQGEVAALIMDQNTLPSEGGVFVPFFGLPVPVSQAVEMLATRRNVPVVLPFCCADRRGHYRAWVETVLKPDDENAGGRSMTERMTTEFEKIIRAHPDKWLWMYKRWKYVPEGAERDAYPYYSRSATAEELLPGRTKG